MYVPPVEQPVLLIGGAQASRGPHNIKEFDPIPKDLETAWAAFKVHITPVDESIIMI